MLSSRRRTLRIGIDWSRRGRHQRTKSRHRRVGERRQAVLVDARGLSPCTPIRSLLTSSSDRRLHTRSGFTLSPTRTRRQPPWPSRRRRGSSLPSRALTTGTPTSAMATSSPLCYPIGTVAVFCCALVNSRPSLASAVAAEGIKRSGAGGCLDLATQWTSSLSPELNCRGELSWWQFDEDQNDRCFSMASRRIIIKGNHGSKTRNKLLLLQYDKQHEELIFHWDPGDQKSGQDPATSHTISFSLYATQRGFAYQPSTITEAWELNFGLSYINHHDMELHIK